MESLGWMQCSAASTARPRTHAMETPAATAAAGDDDRLSELPDCLLTDVLSRLMSRQAARTGALSRRWRHLWRAVPCVDIDQRDFRTSEAINVHAAGRTSQDFRLECDEKFFRCLEEWGTFEDLADRLLPPHGAAPLDTLRLRVSCEAFRPARRIRRGLGRRPVAFHLSCDNDTPHSYFDHRHPCFPDLTLSRHIGAFACRLRTLRLSGVSLYDDFASCLAADFLVLEDLRLEHCAYGFRRLASHSLRKLFIDRCFSEYSSNLALAAPRLASLHINGYPPPVTADDGLPALVAASLTCRAGELGLLRSLRHARSLNLSKFSTAALLGDDEGHGGFPAFHNLRALVLDGCDVGVECQVLRRFLQNAPGLETLALRDCTFPGGSGRSKKRKARSGEETPSAADPCSRTAYECRNLKLIELEFCEGHAVGELARALADISKEVV